MMVFVEVLCSDCNNEIIGFTWSCSTDFVTCVGAEIIGVELFNPT